MYAYMCAHGTCCCWATIVYVYVWYIYVCVYICMYTSDIYFHPARIVFVLNICVPCVCLAHLCALCLSWTSVYLVFVLNICVYGVLNICVRCVCLEHLCVWRLEHLCTYMYGIHRTSESEVVYVCRIYLPIYLCMYVYVSYTYVYVCIHMKYICVRLDSMTWANLCIGWLRWVGSIKLYVSFVEYRLFYRALLQKRPVILSIPLSKATP